MRGTYGRVQRYIFRFYRFIPCMYEIREYGFHLILKHSFISYAHEWRNRIDVWLQVLYLRISTRNRRNPEYVWLRREEFYSTFGFVTLKVSTGWLYYYRCKSMHSTRRMLIIAVLFEPLPGATDGVLVAETAVLVSGDTLDAVWDPLAVEGIDGPELDAVWDPVNGAIVGEKEEEDERPGGAVGLPSIQNERS